MNTVAHEHLRCWFCLILQIGGLAGNVGILVGGIALARIAVKMTFSRPGVERMMMQ